MDVAIAVVSDRKTRVYLHDFKTGAWNNLSPSNGHCQIRVLQRGRKQYCIQVIDEGRPSDNIRREYSLTENCEVTKTQNILQIPITDSSSQPCLLGVQFKDENEEKQFLMRVSGYIRGFGLPLYAPTGAPPPLQRPIERKPPPNPGYIPPTMAPTNTRTDVQQVLPDQIPLATNHHVTALPGGNIRMQDDFGRPPRPHPQDHVMSMRRHDDYPPPQQHQQRMVEDPFRPEDMRGGDRQLPSHRYGNESRHGDDAGRYNPRLDQDYYSHGSRQQQRDYREEPNYGQNMRVQPLQRTPPSRRPNQDPPPSMMSRPREEFQSDMDHYARQLAATLSSCNREQSIQLVDILTTLVAEQREDCNASLGVFSMKFEAEKIASPDTDKPLQLSISVEKFDGDHFPVYLDVHPNDNIERLKQYCQKKFKLPKECQTWIYGSQIPDDKTTLKELGVSVDGETMFVYVQHPKKVKGTTNKIMDRMKEEAGIGAGLLPSNNQYSTPMMSLRSTATGYPLEGDGPQRVNKGRVNIAPVQPPMQPGNGHKQPNRPLTPEQLQFPPGGRPMNDQAVYRGANEHSLANHQHSPVGGIRVMPAEAPRGPPQQIMKEDTPPALPPKPDPPEVKVGWECTACTFCNLPYRPGCSLCDTPRPENYVPPPNYVMTEEEKRFVDQSKEQDALLQKMFQDEQLENRKNAEKNYNNYIQTDDQALVTNNEDFECPVCFLEVEPGNGIVLRSCLHQICKDCLHDSVIMSEHVQVQCPFDDGTYTCEENISDREIRAVLSDQELEGLYNRGLRQAEAAAGNSFHCKTTDCPGFCFYEDEVNEYKCGVCGKLNCILCKAQHEGMNCQQYQDDLKIKAENDEAAKKTQEMLEKMVLDGEGMHCPQCRVIVTKKVGCDWIKCTVCKTEMCWATKGPRWGPKGRGDTSGGCKCGVNRKRCHPNCRNCH